MIRQEPLSLGSSHPILEHVLKIKTLSLKNFRRFKDFQINFEPGLTVLVARNGAGKTSILDGLAICLGAFLTHLPGVKGRNPRGADFRVERDKQNPNRLLRPAFMRLGCELVNGVAWDRSELRDKAQKTRAQVPKGLGLRRIHDYADGFINAYNDKAIFQLPVILYYGAGRGVFDLPARKTGFGKTFDRFDSFGECLESRTNFRRFMEYFYYLVDRENAEKIDRRSFDYQTPELKAIRAAISHALPSMSNPRKADPAGFMVDWLEQGETKSLRFEQLSDGYRTTLAMIMDIAARMVEANPQMADPLQSEGVILIDEIDLHLHPGWQQTILTDLQAAFPCVQFVVTTHSPQVLTTVRPSAIRIIQWMEEEPGLQSVAFSEGAEAQQLLKQILGVAPRPTGVDHVKRLKRYQNLVEKSQWDSSEALALREELDDWGHGHEPELERLDIDIRLKELDR